MGWVLYFRQHKWTKAAMTHNPLLKCQNKRLDFFFPTMTSVHHPGEGKKLKPISNDLSRINRRFFLQRICTMDGLTDSSLEKIMGRQITLSNAFLLTVSFLNVPLLAPPLPTFAWEMLFCFTFWSGVRNTEGLVACRVSAACAPEFLRVSVETLTVSPTLKD